METFSDLRSWEKDEDVLFCRKCRVEFGMTVWKHHCRACGKVLCDYCSCHYIKVPYDEICPDTPVDIGLTNPQRACWDCAERIRARYRAEAEMTAAQNPALYPTRNPMQPTRAPAPSSSANIPTVDAMEYDRRKPSKLYIVQLPQNQPVYPNQAIRVDLGGRINHVVPPYNSRPGDAFYIRTNEVRVTAYSSPDSIITDVYIVDLDTLQEIIDEQATAESIAEQERLQARQRNGQQERLRGGVTASPQSAGVSAAQEQQQEFVECPACTYHNALQAMRCAMCDRELYA